jgi:tripartite-type tricarboxylate transporter receptor subunit TctC
MGRWFRAAAVVATIIAADAGASAQSAFPAKPVHIFVPYAAGGGVDILARTLGDVVSRQWGQTVVVENRPGAGGVVASQALVSAPPDGYTLIVVASGHATNPFLYPKLPYDTFKDFTPISLLASSPNILLVRADSAFKTLSDVIAQARAKPGSLSFAHAGTLCACGDGDVDPSCGRAFEESRQNRHRSHPLQGRCARDQRSARRTNSDVVQQRSRIRRPA